ncbi:MAG TPA: 3D domain-containing protein [Caulobacteraceae bacterium]|jgi:3D (Asp-Asp-Asp) domain-containing protein
MKRTLACLAAVAVAFATQSAHAKSADPIGDLISKTIQGSPGEQGLKLKATLYHIGAKGVGGRDSLGCAVSPMRTLAVDPRFLPKRSIVFIQETVGMRMPGGGSHDGLWYASDTGGAIKGSRVDMFTGAGRNSMQQFMKKGLNLAVLSATKVGTFKGCPPR